MAMNHPNDVYRLQVDSLLESKRSEFKVLGYEEVSNDLLWKYLIDGKWRKISEQMPIHQVVSDLFGIRVTDFMNHASVEAIKSGLLSKDTIEIDLGDLKDLL